MTSQWFDRERLGQAVTPSYASYPAIAPPSFPCRPGTSILIDGKFEGSLTRTEKQACHWNGKEYTIKRGRPQRVTIDVLPDVALLEIFEYYTTEDQRWGNDWRKLVHVCRKWRDVVFGSPLRLDLRLYCSTGTPVRETLNVWPLLPIELWGVGNTKWGVDNIIAVLEHKNRICRLRLYEFSSSEYEEVFEEMQQPFPALTDLRLMHTPSLPPPVVLASFLGGSAPSLKHLALRGIPFPGLPKLLLSATHLANLYLLDIPHSGYISPETMVTCLSVLTRLEVLSIEFKSPQSRPDRNIRRPPPQTRTPLPVLTNLLFKGVVEYLDDLVSRIDAPVLDHLEITLFHRLILETPQLTQFISRTPKFKAHDEVHMVFSNDSVLVKTFDGNLELTISCTQSDWQLSSLEQVCSSFFPHALIPMVERVYISEGKYLRPHWQDDIESSQWLELLHLFVDVKGLHISQEFEPRIAPALGELVGERVTEVLPALETLFLEEPPLSGAVQEGIGRFVAARLLAGHTIAVFHWERMDLE